MRNKHDVEGQRRGLLKTLYGLGTFVVNKNAFGEIVVLVINGDVVDVVNSEAAELLSLNHVGDAESFVDDLITLEANEIMMRAFTFYKSFVQRADGEVFESGSELIDIVGKILGDDSEGVTGGHAHGAVVTQSQHASFLLRRHASGGDFTGDHLSAFRIERKNLITGFNIGDALGAGWGGDFGVPYEASVEVPDRRPNVGTFVADR